MITSDLPPNVKSIVKSETRSLFVNITVLGIIYGVFTAALVVLLQSIGLILSFIAGLVISYAVCYEILQSAVRVVMEVEGSSVQE